MMPPHELEAAIMFDDVAAQPGEQYELTSTGFVWIFDYSRVGPPVARKAPLLGLFRPMWVRIETPRAFAIASVKIGNIEHLIASIPAGYLSPPRLENALILSAIRGEDVLSLTVVAHEPARLRLALEGRYLDERGN